MKMIFFAIAAALSLAYRVWTSPAEKPAAHTDAGPQYISCLPPVSDTNRLEGKWYLLPVLPSDTATGKLPFISFDIRRLRFAGNTGCNSMSGRFNLRGKSLSIDSNMIITKMACTGYNEKGFIKNLLRANSYKFEDGVLILLFDGTELSRWVRTVQKPRSYKA